MKEKQQHTEIKSINFSRAELPKFEEVVNKKEWVYFGEDNLAPKHLVDYYNYSPTHHSCISSKRDGVIGNSLFSTDEDQDLRLISANPMESVYDVFKKCALDMVLFGCYSLNIIWKQDRELGISEFYHIDVSKLRVGKADELDYVKDYFYSGDWSNLRKYPTRKIPSFNPLNDEPSQIYYHKPYSPNTFYYAQPDYVAGITSINTEVEIGRFHLKNIQNSFHPSLWVNLNSGIPSTEERDSIFKHLTDRYSGSDNAGRLMVSFNEDAASQPEITQIDNNTNDTLFGTLNEMTVSNILTANRITSGLLLGIKNGDNGGLGSNKDELLVSYNHFLNTVVKPIQQQLLDGFQKVLFLRDQKTIELFIEKNTIIDIEDRIDE